MIAGAINSQAAAALSFLIWMKYKYVFFFCFSLKSIRVSCWNVCLNFPFLEWFGRIYGIRWILYICLRLNRWLAHTRNEARVLQLFFFFTHSVAPIVLPTSPHTPNHSAFRHNAHNVTLNSRGIQLFMCTRLLMFNRRVNKIPAKCYCGSDRINLIVSESNTTKRILQLANSTRTIHIHNQNNGRANGGLMETFNVLFSTECMRNEKVRWKKTRGPSLIVVYSLSVSSAASASTRFTLFSI